MATVAKFYLLDAATPNTGTMPGASDAFVAASSGGGDAQGDATGARTARDATDVAGTSNPDIESSFTSNATTTNQAWGHRRFVSRPLAAQTFAVGDGNWQFTYAGSESSLLHNQIVLCTGYAWRPSTGARVGSADQLVQLQGTEPTVAATEQSQNVFAGWITSLTIADGDILVFDISSQFTQGMATAYTEQFAYDGTTEGSTTTSASFVMPPAALTLFTGTAPGLPFQFDPIPFMSSSGRTNG